MQRRPKKYKKFSAELKLQAVKDYLNGKGSCEALKEKYKLRSSTQLKNQVMWYNGHKEFPFRRKRATNGRPYKLF